MNERELFDRGGKSKIWNEREKNMRRQLVAVGIFTMGEWGEVIVLKKLTVYY